MTDTPPLAIDLDAIGDTQPLWHAWLESVSGVLAIDPGSLAQDRGLASAELDAGGGGNWRTLLERFAEDHAPAYLRRDAATSTALRSLAGRGVAMGVFTDAPEPLARVALAQLGATRRISLLESGTDALDRVVGTLGPHDRRPNEERPPQPLVEFDTWTSTTSEIASSMPCWSVSTGSPRSSSD